MDFEKLSTFLPQFMTLREQANGILFFANQQTIAIFWNVKKNFLFDSHKRDQNGKPISNGNVSFIDFSRSLEFKRIHKRNVLYS